MRALLVIALALWSHAATDCGGKKAGAPPPGAAATTTALPAPPPPPPTAQPAAAVTVPTPPAASAPAEIAPPAAAAGDGSMNIGGTGTAVKKGSAPARRPKSASGLTSDPCEGGQ